MKITKKRLREIIREELIKEDFGHAAKQLPTFSSKEAKKVVDNGLRMWAKDLRKVEHKVIKDWMSKAKAGVLDYFDIMRGIKTNSVQRTHPYEAEFLVNVLRKDKIIDRFRSYFGGRKRKR